MATAQPGYGRQFDKTHATTVTATATVAAHRFIAYDGGYAAATPGAANKFSQGASEYGAQTGEALSVITGYSALVEAGEGITLGAWVKPGSDGKAVVGDVDDHCGRALGTTTGTGQLVEVELLTHLKFTQGT